MQTQQLTFIRFLAAIAIVIFHFGVNTFPFDEGFINTLSLNGNVGVTFFYTLSGFVMMMAYYTKEQTCNWVSYMRNRVARIFPLYYLAFGLMAVYLFIRLYILKLPFTYHPQLSDIVFNLTFLQSWIPYKALTFNTAAWSLSVEMLFYVSFPFILNKIVKQTSFKNFTLICIIVYIVSQFLTYLFINSSFVTNDGLFWHYFPLLHINSFLSGIWFGLLFFKRRVIKNNTVLINIIFIISLLCILFKPQSILINNGLISILYGYLIYMLACDSGIISKLFIKKPLVILGEASYGIYILQFPIYFFFTGTLNAIGIEMKGYYFFYYVVVLIILSSLSYLYIEKPMRAKIKAIKI